MRSGLSNAYRPLARAHPDGVTAAAKSVMIGKPDSVVVLPGGFGMLDETCDVITRKQLGLSTAVVAFIDVGRYRQKFVKFVHYGSGKE